MPEKVLLENDRVRVIEVRLKPGENTGLQSEPDRVAYVLSGGKVKFSFPDGKAMEFEAKQGNVIWRKAEDHVVENVGSTDIHGVVVKLKESRTK